MAEQKEPAFLWYPKQWLGDDKVLLMDWDARAMHHWLLNLSFQQEPAGTIPNDDAILTKWLGQPSAEVWERCKPQILSAWTLNEQTNRLEQLGLIRCLDIREKRKHAGSRGGRAKSSKSLASAIDLLPINELANLETETAIETVDELPVLTPGENLDELVSEIGHLHPANAHLEGKPLPYNQETTICEAIVRDGHELVRAGTLNYRHAVAEWPPGERRFVVNPVKFYGESQYLKDPEEWKRLSKEDIREQKLMAEASIGSHRKYVPPLKRSDEELAAEWGQTVEEWRASNALVAKKYGIEVSK